MRWKAMSAKDLFYSSSKKFSKSEERALLREKLVYNVTEDILVALEDLEMSKKVLSRALGKSASFVTQLLNGRRNMTLGTLSDICWALGIKPEIRIEVPQKDVQLVATVDVQVVADTPRNSWEEYDNRCPKNAKTRRSKVIAEAQAAGWQVEEAA